MKTSRRFKRIYQAITGVYLVMAAGLAASGLWLLGIALLLMGGVMTGASRHMEAVDPPGRGPETRDAPGAGRP